MPTNNLDVFLSIYYTRIHKDVVPLFRELGWVTLKNCLGGKRLPDIADNVMLDLAGVVMLRSIYDREI